MTSLHSDIGGVNYAHYAGFESVEAAITFAVLYVLLITLYVYLATKLSCYFIPILVLSFCALRVMSFTVRAFLAGRGSVGQDLHLVVLHVYVYDLGFLTLLYNAYMVVRNCELPSNASLFQRAVGRIVRNRMFINIVFLVIYALCGLGAPRTSAVDDIKNINHPNISRIIIICLLFGLAVLIAMQGLLFVRQELSSTSTDKEAATPPDPPYPMYAICLIVLLLLVRQTFFMVTLANQKAQHNEKLFYPLSALTEFVAACLFVPPWEELVTIRGMQSL